LRELPYSHYSTVYFPFDMPGFVRDMSPPRRELPPDLVRLGEVARQGYRDHVPARMPANFVQRSQTVITESVGHQRVLLLLGVPFAAMALPSGTLLFIVSAFICMIAAYLLMPHHPQWTIYYLEVFGAAPALAAIGFVAGLTSLRRRIAHDAPWARIPKPGYVIVGLGLAILAGLPRQLATMDFNRSMARVRQVLARDLIAELPNPHAVVFVKRSEQLTPHLVVTDILGQPFATPTWIVRDLGESTNAEVLSQAGERVPYLLDEDEMTLIPYPARRFSLQRKPSSPDTAAGSATTPAGP
jgi:hypothetical protein